MKRHTIMLPSEARRPTDKEIREAKRYIIMRGDVAATAQEQAGELIQDAAEDLVRIAYRYNIPVDRFAFDDSVSEPMMEEVSAVMENLDEELMEEIEEDALSCTKDIERKDALLLFLLALGHRNHNFVDTLYAYEWRMLRQVEALVASYLSAGLSATEAVGCIRTDIISFNQSKTLLAALRHPNDYAAEYIRNGGKATFPDGSPNIQGVYVEGYNAIKFMFGTSIAQVWMHNQLLDMQSDNECIGYIQDRGSTYNCQTCDDEVGFHPLSDATKDEWPHPGCQCYRVPVYRNGEAGDMITSS